jgi:hypothetical protein
VIPIKIMECNFKFEGEWNNLGWSYKVANGVTEIRPHTSMQKIKYLEQALKTTHPHIYSSV